jgi:signal transduction histidine kinase/CheY-like chemotaxis protein
MPSRSLETARRTGRFDAEGWRVRKDGSFFWASVVIDAIRDNSGHLIGFAKITRDVTERRNSQLALEKVQQQLSESQKMDALGQLTGGVAHDFNNLLMIVTGHINTLKRAAEHDPKAVRAANAIELAAQRGATLTRQLLSFSRRQRVNPEPTSVVERINAIREVLTSGLGGGVRLLIDVETDAWPITIDRSEFEIALVNLVINARDAMPEGGSVTITAKNVQREDDPQLAPGEYVAISVEDTGVGIPEDVVGKVFDPFFTTKPVGKGTGLGLSQVHGFVHQAGGSVAVNSKLGQGTTITMYFPRSQQDPVKAANDEFNAVPRETGTVLLVEDNPEVASASRGLLEQLGYSVRWASDAGAALTELEQDDIDVVFSDIVMPGRMDGFGLARTIRERHPALPILLATGYSDAAHNAGVEFPILRKPYQIHELSRALSALPRRRRHKSGRKAG